MLENGSSLEHLTSSNETLVARIKNLKEKNEKQEKHIEALNRKLQTYVQQVALTCLSYVLIWYGRILDYVVIEINWK